MVVLPKEKPPIKHQNSLVHYRDRIEKMPSQSLANMIADLKCFDVSDNFIRGTLFAFAAALMLGESRSDLNWLIEHEMTQEFGDDLLGRMHKRQIQAAVNEFVYKLDNRDVLNSYLEDDLFGELHELPLHRCLPEVSFSGRGELGPYSKLYFALIEEIGRCLALSDFGYEQSYLSGQYFCRLWFDLRGKGLSTHLRIIVDLFARAPPALVYFWQLPKSADYAPGRYLPSQTALQGIFGAWDESFKKILWAYQSWMFFRKGVPIPGVENLTPVEFYDHCYANNNLFYEPHGRELALLVEPTIELDLVPAWTGTNKEKAALFEYMFSRWGYNPAQQVLPMIERKQVNACTIFSLFCSMWKAAKLH